MPNLNTIGAEEEARRGAGLAFSLASNYDQIQRKLGEHHWSILTKSPGLGTSFETSEAAPEAWDDESCVVSYYHFLLRPSCKSDANNGYIYSTHYPGSFSPARKMKVAL
jgi:hypothetical protein